MIGVSIGSSNGSLADDIKSANGLMLIYGL